MLKKLALDVAYRLTAVPLYKLWDLTGSGRVEDLADWFDERLDGDHRLRWW